MGKATELIRHSSSLCRGMPIERSKFEKGKDVGEMRWKSFEKAAIVSLEQRFAKRFHKRRVMLGKFREIDAVSEDGMVLAQVKHTSKLLEDFTNEKKRNYFANYMLDALILERSPGSTKLLVIYPEEWKNWFVEESKGLISPQIEVITVPWRDDGKRR